MMGLRQERFKTISAMALPIMGGMLSGNLLSLIDTAMVGTLGDVALAAVGLGGVAQTFALSVIFGLSVAVQARVARRKGEDCGEEARPLNAGLVLALVIGVPFSLLFLQFVPLFFELVNDDPAVTALGTDYLRLTLLSLAGLGMNFSFRGFWNGMGDTRVYMRTLIAIHVTNILFNYLLIFGKFGFPEMGCSGAGLASVIAVYFGSALYAGQAWLRSRDKGFMSALPAVGELAGLFRHALPTGVQNLVMACGGVVFLWLIALLGTSEVAAANVLMKITRALLFPAVALGFTASTLVGQALGRKDVGDAQDWIKEIAGLSAFGIALLGVPLVVVPDLVLGIFLDNPETIRLAELPLRLVGIGAGVGASAHTLMYSLLGAGDNRRVLVISLMNNWCIYLPGVYVLSTFFGWGLTGAYVANLSYGVILALSFGLRVKSGKWQKIQL